MAVLNDMTFLRAVLYLMAAFGLAHSRGKIYVFAIGRYDPIL